MPHYRVREASALLGVSDDTVRRWIDSGTLPAEKDEVGRLIIEGATLAEFSRSHAATPAPDPSGVGRSARNRFVGLVTKVIADGVMAQVEVQCGPHTVVSLMSSEAVRELGLEPGRMAVAVVKATTVIIETPGGSS
jgi:molybdopterin-binding protein